MSKKCEHLVFSAENIQMAKTNIHIQNKIKLYRIRYDPRKQKLNTKQQQQISHLKLDSFHSSFLAP